MDTFGHLQSPPVTREHLQSLVNTSSFHQIPPLTRRHLQSPSFTQVIWVTDGRCSRAQIHEVRVGDVDKRGGHSGRLRFYLMEVEGKIYMVDRMSWERDCDTRSTLKTPTNSQFQWYSIKARAATKLLQWSWKTTKLWYIPKWNSNEAATAARIFQTMSDTKMLIRIPNNCRC